MRAFLKKSLILFLIFIITFAPVMAKDSLKMYGNINNEVSFQNLPNTIKIVTVEEYTLADGTVIPKNAVVESEVMQVQRERRWHKSGYILCKLKSYQLYDEVESVNESERVDQFENETEKKAVYENEVATEIVDETETENTALTESEETTVAVNEHNAETVDLSDKNIYFAVRKYEKIEGKEAAILTTEIIITQAAGIVGSCFIFFAPVDIAYFFTKGAIRREKHHNWFKAGVHDAYDNSIFWFWLKGKPIELKEMESVKIQSVPEKKALKLESQIAKRNAKQAVRDEKKQVKLEAKEEKHQMKLAKEKEKNPVKFEKKMEKLKVRQQKRDARITHEIAVQQEIFARREQKAQQRREKKELKRQIKQEKAEQKIKAKAEKKKSAEAIDAI